MTTLSKLTCPACGATLQVPPDADHVQCSYCGVQLQVQRDGSAAAARLSQQLTASLQQMQKLTSLQVQLAAVQGEIRALDRQKGSWKRRRELRALRRQEDALIQRIEALQAEAGLTAEEDAGLAAPVATAGNKDWLVTYLLCLFLGLFGAHRLYTEDYLIGGLQFFTMGGYGVWWLVDLYQLGSGRYRDARGATLRQPRLRLGMATFWAALAVAVVFAVTMWGLDGRGAYVALPVAAGVFLYVYYRLS